MLHRDRAGLVIADLGIDVLDDMPIDFVRQGVFPVQLLYDVCRDRHLFLFRVVQGIVIFCRGLFYFLLLRLVQGHSPVLGQQVHRLNLGDFGQHGILYILLQGHAFPGNVPHLRAIDTLVLVLGIGQIHYHLRYRAGRAADPEHLVLPEPCSKDHSRAALPVPAACQHQDYKGQAAQQHRKTSWRP